MAWSTSSREGNYKAMLRKDTYPIKLFTDSDFSFATIKSLCTVFSMIFYIFKNKTFFKPKFPSSSFLIHKLVIVLENRLIYNQLLVYNEHLRVNESRFMYYISKI